MQNLYQKFEIFLDISNHRIIDSNKSLSCDAIQGNEFEMLLIAQNFNYVIVTSLPSLHTNILLECKILLINVYENLPNNNFKLCNNNKIVI